MQSLSFASDAYSFEIRRAGTTYLHISFGSESTFVNNHTGEINRQRSAVPPSVCGRAHKLRHRSPTSIPASTLNARIKDRYGSSRQWHLAPRCRMTGARTHPAPVDVVVGIAETRNIDDTKLVRH